MKVTRTAIQHGFFLMERVPEEKVREERVQVERVQEERVQDEEKV
jgi:hypothetical protein